MPVRHISGWCSSLHSASAPPRSEQHCSTMSFYYDVTVLEPAIYGLEPVQLWAKINLSSFVLLVSYTLIKSWQKQWSWQTADKISVFCNFIKIYKHINTCQNLELSYVKTKPWGLHFIRFIVNLSLPLPLPLTRTLGAWFTHLVTSSIKCRKMSTQECLI